MTERRFHAAHFDIHNDHQGDIAMTAPVEGPVAIDTGQAVNVDGGFTFH